VGEGQLRENGEIEIVLVLNQAFNLSIEGGKNKATIKKIIQKEKKKKDKDKEKRKNGKI
jgi:hypothetical protein